MRISFILPTATMNGGTRVVGIYAHELMRRGHTVCLISLPPRRQALTDKLRSWVKEGSWPTDQFNSSSHLDNFELDHRILDRWRPITDDDVPDADIVIATWWETAEWVSKLSQKKGTKVYFIQHHEVFPYLPKRSRQTYRLPLHKVVVAQWLKQTMIREYGDPVVDLVPNSVDHSQFFASPRGKQRRPTIGLIYASAPFKGLELSLAALRVIGQGIPSLRIVCFGSEPVRPDLSLPKGWEFFLDPPQNEIRSLYAQCDVWVTASNSEGFNLPAMEAMACRTPVVSTRAGWPAEAVKTGWNGVLVDVEDLNGLADGINWILSRVDHDWRILSANAYATVSSSSWENSATRFELALEHARLRAAEL